MSRFVGVFNLRHMPSRVRCALRCADVLGGGHIRFYQILRMSHFVGSATDRRLYGPAYNIRSDRIGIHPTSRMESMRDVGCIPFRALSRVALVT